MGEWSPATEIVPRRFHFAFAGLAAGYFARSACRPRSRTPFTPRWVLEHECVELTNSSLLAATHLTSPTARSHRIFLLYGVSFAVTLGGASEGKIRAKAEYPLATFPADTF
jgi:hypothetical protein